MKYRHLLAVLLLCAMLSVFIPPCSVSAVEMSADTITVTTVPSSEAPQIGDSVTFSFRFSGVSAELGINGYSFHVDYDRTALEFENCTFQFTSGNAQYNCVDDGDMLHLYWTKTLEISSDREMVTLTFKTLKPGNTTVTPQLTEDDCFSFYGFDENNNFRDVEYPVVCLSASVYVQPDLNTEMYYSASDITGCDTVTTVISLHNLEKVHGGQVALTYDTAKLEFVSGTLSNELFAYGYISCNTPGRVRIAGCNSSANPVNGDGALATVTFRLIDENRQAGDVYDLGLEFFVPEQPLYSSVNGNIINITKVYTVNGTVTVEDPAVDPYDLNGDGEHNIADVTVLLDYLAGSKNLNDGVTGDLDASGSVDIADVSALLDYLATV